MKKITFTFASLLIGGSLLAQIDEIDDNGALELSGGSISTAVPFLIISPDARGGAMGDAGVASSPDINSQHWNAAKYSFMEGESGISLTYSPWLRLLVQDMNLAYLTGYWRLGDNFAMGGSLRYFSLGTVIFRSGPEDPGAEYKPNEFAIDLSLARKLTEELSMAVAFRYIRSDLTNGFQGMEINKSSAANSVAADVSMYYTRELNPPAGLEGSSFALGFNISNIGAKLSYSASDLPEDKDFLPANLRFGGSYTMMIDPYNQLTAMIDLNKMLVPTPPVWNISKDTIIGGMDNKVTAIQAIFQSFHDAPGGFREEMQEINISLGAEYLYNKILAFRGGYFHENKHKGGRQYFTLGVGLRLTMLEVEMSYLLPRSNNAHNPLKNTLRFTLKMNLSDMRKQDVSTNR